MAFWAASYEMEGIMLIGAVGVLSSTHPSSPISSAGDVAVASIIVAILIAE
jgi:hypothetical protein